MFLALLQVVDAPLRKKVTKVGSGAWSIYLPKKWIDAWEPAQQEGREVDVRYIGGGLLVSPVIIQSNYTATLPSHAETVRLRLLSAYLRGYHHVVLRPTEAFDNECIAVARDFLRHLDERLEATCTQDAIGYRLRSDLPAAIGDADDLLSVMTAKVREVLRLAEEAVGTYSHDPDRALHALRLLRDTHEEDVARLFYQATRQVATLDIPMPSVSAYQLLGLTAADLHRVSETGMRVGQAILLEYGLDFADLDYPRPHLMEKMRLPDIGSGLPRDITRIARDHFGLVGALLEKTMRAVTHSELEELMSIPGESDAIVAEIRKKVYGKAGEYWGASEPTEPAPTLAAVRHTTSLIQALDHLRTIATTALALKAAE